jgi:hypothetical protein
MPVAAPRGNEKRSGDASLPARSRGERRIDRNHESSKSPRMCWAIIACARAHPGQARCGPPMSLLPETALWNRCVPKDFP